MRRSWAWLGVSLLILAGAGIWLLREPSQAGPATPASDQTRSATAMPGQVGERPVPESPSSAGAPAPDSREARVDPGSIALPANAPGPADLLPHAGAWSFLYRAPSGNARKAQRDAWKEHVEPLVYPPDHPRAGQYREGVTLQDAVDARMEYAKSLFPEAELHRPYHHIVKPISFATVNELKKGWKPEDLVSGDEYARRLREAPPEPEARDQNLWIPGSPSDPQTTTNAEVIERALIGLEAPAFIHPRS